MLKKLFFLLCLAFQLSLLSGKEKAPNIVLIVADDMQACFGNFKSQGAKTPNLDRLAKEGVSFTKAYCQFPVCGASRASFMSGLYPQTNGFIGNSHKTFKETNPTLIDHPSLGEFLIQQGYYSARVSKIFHLGVPGEVEQGSAGADMPLCWDYTYNITGPELYSPGRVEITTPDNRHHGSTFYIVEVPDHLAETQPDQMGTTQAIAFLENRAHPLIPKAKNKTKLKPEAPFFLALGMLRPHVPLIAPSEYFNLYPLDQIEVSQNPEGHLSQVPKSVSKSLKFDDMTIEQQKKTLQAYYASISYMDAQVGRVLDALDRLKLRDDTIVIFMSDHGYNLGEHTTWQKMSFWEDTTRVPLIISSPEHKKANGQVCQSLVELIDLYPTLGDLAGFKNKLPEILEGESLRPYLENPEKIDTNQIAHTVMKKGTGSLRYQTWRYSKYPDGEQLYDLEKDPGEFNNLVKNPEYAKQLDLLRSKLNTLQGQ